VRARARVIFDDATNVSAYGRLSGVTSVLLSQIIEHSTMACKRKTQDHYGRPSVDEHNDAKDAREVFITPHAINSKEIKEMETELTNEKAPPILQVDNHLLPPRSSEWNAALPTPCYLFEGGPNVL